MRIGVIDIIKGISIIMIVNVHLISGQFFSIGCTYHVIAFFFTAGLIHGVTEKWKQQSLLSFIKKRLKQLGYPFLTLSLCYILMHVILNFLRGDALNNIVITDSLLKTITLRGIGTLWFFPVLFFGDIIFYGVKRLSIHSSLLVLVGVLMIIIASVLNNHGVFLLLDQIHFFTITISDSLKIVVSGFIASGFIALGHLIYKLFPNLFHDSRFELVLASSILLVVCIICFVIDFRLLDLYQGDLHKLDLNNPFIYIICSLTGLSFVTSLALLINKTSRRLSCFLSFLGRNSIIVMTTHSEYYINSVANLLVVYCICTIGVSISSTIVSGIVLFLIILIELGVIYIVNHTFLKYIYNLGSHK